MSPRKEEEPKASKAPKEASPGQRGEEEGQGRRPEERHRLRSRSQEDGLTTAYRFTALDQSGKKVSGVEMALSSGAVHMVLLERGLQPLEVTTKKSVLTFEITKKKVPRSDVMNFTRQLAVFMKAGIPIMEALEVIVEETQNKLLRQNCPRSH